MRKKQKSRLSSKSASSSPSPNGKPRPEGTQRSDPKTGRFLPLAAGERGARTTHGLRAFDKRGSDAVPEEIKAATESFIAEAFTELGGSEECSTIKRGELQQLARVDTVCRMLWDDIRRHGPMTARGKMRNSTQAFLQAVDRFDRLATRLGFDRRAKRVTDLARAFVESPHGE